MKKIVSIGVGVIFSAILFVAPQAQAADCPFSAGSGDILVNFSERLYSQTNPDYNWKHQEIVSQNVPAGTYRVSLASEDTYDRRENVYQPDETFFVKFNNGGETVTQSNRTPDLQDYVRSASWHGVVNESLTISKDINKVIAYHAAYIDESCANSINPICILLEPAPKPVSGECGDADGGDGAPDESKLCKVGKPSTVRKDGTKWYWTCNGIDGGKVMECSSGGAAECGNGTKETGEQCDDGNKIDHDGCSSKCRIEIPSISIDKNSIDGKDEQKIAIDGEARFKITVVNNGKVSLKNVVINDAKASACNRSSAQTNSKYDGTTFDPGESFSYTCIHKGVQKSYENEAVVKGDVVTGNKKVESDDTSQVIVNGTASISIDKNDTDNKDDNQTVEKGKKATYTIKVTNNGDQDLEEVVISDKIAPNCDRIGSDEGKETLKSGESFTYTCEEGNVQKTHINTISVTAKVMGGDGSVGDSDKTNVTVNGTKKPPVLPPTEEPEPEDKDCDGSIGNTVWHDKNANGKQDAGEPGIPGVRVWLNKGNKVFKDTTNSQGHYKFKNLCSGKFRVTVKHEDIADLYQTYDPDGKLDHYTKVRLKGDKDKHTKADFGYRGAVAPATGPGIVISIILAAVGTGFIIYLYRRRRMKGSK